MRVNKELQTALALFLQNLEGDEGIFCFGKMNIPIIRVDSEKGRILENERKYEGKNVIYSHVKGNSDFFAILR